jgi:hypothetical protein
LGADAVATALGRQTAASQPAARWLAEPILTDANFGLWHFNAPVTHTWPSCGGGTEAAPKLVGARYGPFGVLAPGGDRPSAFTAVGIDAKPWAVIGELSQILGGVYQRTSPR